jgi:hypothetical protein
MTKPTQFGDEPFFFGIKKTSFITLFFGAKKRDKRNIHPNPSFPYMGRLNRSYSSLFH